MSEEKSKDKQNLESTIKELDFKLQPVESWAAFTPEVAIKEGQEFLRAKGSAVVYRKTDDGYKCLKCDSDVMAGTVAHPIWDGSFPMSGSGRCHYEQVPYCPKCEKQPNSGGTPIKVGPKF